MEKTILVERHYQQILEDYPDPRPGMSVDFKKLATIQEYFCKYALGMQPRAWQSMFWANCRQSNRVAACTARQIGKTVALSVYALQAAFFNTKPVGFKKRTLVIIVSSTEEQSKQVMDNIRSLIYAGDANVEKLTNGKMKKFFSSEISKGERNDKSVISFNNGCRIISLPPTNRVRGYSPSVVFVDEAAFLEDEDIYNNAIKPLVADTNGQIVLTTTPNGQQGYFFNLFDPYDDRENHEYNRLWFDYHCIKYDDPEREQRMMIEERIANEMGDSKRFAQENLADFTAQVGAFFEIEQVDACVDKEMVKQEGSKLLCDLGVDFGKEVSRTVISIIALDSDGKTIRLLYQYEYPAKNDLSLIGDIESLMKRFNVQRIIFESCPADETFRQMAKVRGWNMTEFVPQAEKLRKYTAFRQRVATGKFKMYREPELLLQMKGLQYEETPRTTKIYAGSGLRDDRVDSVIIAGKYILEDNGSVKMFDWDEV
jgi:hypothetical protein